MLEQVRWTEVGPKCTRHSPDLYGHDTIDVLGYNVTQCVELIGENLPLL